MCAASPEVDGAQSDQHARQHRGLLSQHDGSFVVEPPVRSRSKPSETGSKALEAGLESHLVVLVSLSAVETYSDRRFSISATRIQARPWGTT